MSDEPIVDLTSLIAQLDQAKAAHAEHTAEVEAAKIQLELDMAQVDEAERVLSEKRKARDSTDAKRRLAKAQALADYNTVGNLERLIAQEQANELSARRALEKRQLIEDLTANAEWRTKLKPHQLDGAVYLASAQRAVCADEMGVGKTPQIIVTMDILEALGDGGRKVLCLLPQEMVSVFMEELRIWAPDRAAIKLSGLGGLANTLEAFEMYSKMLPEEGTYVCGYELYRRTASKALQDMAVLQQFDTVICDEAHNIKETDNAGFKSVMKLVKAYNTCPVEGCGRVTMSLRPDNDRVNYRMGLCIMHGEVESIQSVKNVYPMTGTPIINRPDEIYPLLHLVNSAAFPNKNKFGYDYCTKGWDNKLKWKEGGQARLASKIKGSYIQRSRTDAGIILPPQHITTHTIEFDRVKYQKQAYLLQMLKEHSQILIEEGKAADMKSILALITRMRQATCWPGGIWLDLPDPQNPWTAPPVRTHVGALYEESAKMDRAVELADEFVDAGQRYILFSQFKEAIDEFQRRRGDKVVAYHGGTPEKVREEIKRNFNRLYGEAPKWEGLAAHYHTGGIGLTLTAATQIIVLDEEWSPAMNAQAYARINRMGQSEETGVHILHLENSIDQWLADIIVEKRKIVDGFEMEITFAQLADIFNQL
jgi:SWI/SNF-related matrix-associated actin-dependent regulator 1 of chromatin subfamily A